MKWIDHATTYGWRDPEFDTYVLTCESLGWVHKINKKVISVSASITYKQQERPEKYVELNQVADITTILWVCVKEWSLIK